MIRRGPLTMLLARPLALAVLGLLLLLEVIFLAESLQTQMENVLRVRGTLLQIWILVAMKAPEIVDFALPIAFLVAVFVVVSDARRMGELGVLAAAGLPWQRVVAFVAMAGLLGGLTSFLIAAFAVPASLYAQRMALDALKLSHVEAAIRDPGELGSVQSFDGVTFVALAPDPTAPQEGTLLLFDEEAEFPWRFALTRDWRITGPAADGEHRLEMRRLTAYPDSPAAGSATGGAARMGRTTIRKVEVGFDLAELAPRFDRMRRLRELPAISAGLLDDGSDAVPDPERLAKIVMRATLVPGAALVALIMLVLSDRGIMRYLALPAGLVLVVAADVAGPAVLAGLEGREPAAMALATGVLAALYVLVPLLALSAVREALMMPRRGGR